MSRISLAVSIVLSMSLAAEAASAQQETCPPGSTWKAEGSAGWCEPSVCATDMDCKSGEVCKPIPLCVEIGKTDPSKPDGGVLMARQKCGENKSCPSSTVCSDKGRCLSRDAAEKLGLLGAAKTDGASSTPPKKACGCKTPGAPVGNGAALLVGLGLVAYAVTRRIRRA